MVDYDWMMTTCKKCALYKLKLISFVSRLLRTVNSIVSLFGSQYEPLHSEEEIIYMVGVS